MTYHSKMTSKGQITVPKAVRDELGISPGEPVEFVKNEQGETVIRAMNAEEHRRQREQEILKRIRAAQARFREQDQMPGISTDAYYELMRGPPAEV